MESVTVRDISGDLVEIVFSNLQEASWLVKDRVIQLWMNDTSFYFNRVNFPDDESWDMVLQATDLEST